MMKRMNSDLPHFGGEKQRTLEGKENLPVLDVEHAIESKLSDAVTHLKEGSYYEINHSELPRKSPEQLKSIRIVMVSKKTVKGVSLRFPSMHSLLSHFSGENHRTSEGNENLPALDVKHVMEPKLAGEVLYRRIPHEIVVTRNSLKFWAIKPSHSYDVSRERISSPAANTRLRSVVSEDGSCLHKLRSAAMLKWGYRRRMQYLNQRVEEKKNEKEENHEVKDAEEENGEEEIDEEEDDGNEIDGSEDGEKNEEEDDQSRRSTEKTNPHVRKRRLTASYSANGRAKRTKSEKRNQIVVYKNTQKKAAKEFIDRWCAERYKLAEKNMLTVMKEQNAVFGSPILRVELRAEARKLIGDTGLLDHLLKHMAGKVAPGGQDRFMRRHNAEGAMEYWVESADLLNIREQAGVQDPFWTPPSGWKLGDNPNQDPVCAREIKELRDEIAHLKRQMEKLTSKRQEEDLAIVTTPNSCVSSQNLDHDILLIPLKEGLERLKSRAEESGPYKPDSTETPLSLKGSPSITQGDKKDFNLKIQDTESSVMTQADIAQYKSNPREDRAAKIERPKSGFRMCKPEGSFIWPNMTAMMPPPHHHHEVVVPTMASVSLPSQLTWWYHHPPCPVKPLAEKHPVIANSPPAVTTLPCPSPRAETSINLNEAARNIDNDTGICRNQIH